MATALWDPADGVITPDSFQRGRNELDKKYEAYRAHPRRPLFYLGLCFVPLGIAVVILALNPQLMSILARQDNNDLMALIIMTLVPPGLYMRHVRKIQTDLIKRLIADKKGWVYSPDENRARWGRLADKFPEFLRKGDEGQNLQDEFWGAYEGPSQTVPFYSGLFEYAKVIRGRRSRHRRIYTHTLFAVRLNKTLTTDFQLMPENSITKFFNWFRKKEIETESAEFNDAFSVFYKGEKMENELDIVKVLSPAVQVKLLEIKKAQGPFGLAFRQDMMLVVFHRNLFKKMHTNFFKKVELDPRDEEALGNTLKTILEIASELVPFLD